MKAKVGFIQTPLADNRSETALRLLEEAVSKGCDLVALPEMWLTGFNFTEKEEKEANNFLKSILDLSKGSDTLIIAGTFPEREGKKLFNTAYAIHNGRVIHKRRKLYLFAPMGETEIFSPGNPPEVFAFKFLNIAIVICYELRFPSVFDRIMKDKVNFIVVPAQWPKPREEHWKILLRARAVETQSFVMGVNVVGKTKKLSFSGFSALIHPLGYPLIEASHTEGLFISHIDTEEMETYRSQIPVLRDAITYGNI